MAVNSMELYAFLKGGWHRTDIITNGPTQTIYQGKATGSGAVVDPVWCIKRTTIITREGHQVIQEDFADGNMNYDNIWRDRQELNYSICI